MLRRAFSRTEVGPDQRLHRLRWLAETALYPRAPGLELIASNSASPLIRKEPDGSTTEPLRLPHCLYAMSSWSQAFQVALEVITPARNSRMLWSRR